MSETEKTVKVKDTDNGIIIKLTGTQKRRVFMATLPWAVIVIATALFIGNVYGWNTRGSDQSRIESAASALVQSVSKTTEQN